MSFFTIDQRIPANRRHWIKGIGACSVVALLTLGANAETNSFYVSENTKELAILSWDTSNPNGTKNYQSIGTMDYRMFDIALLPDGRLLGISGPGTYGANSALFEINRATAAITLIGDTGYQLNALTFDPLTQKLLGAGYTDFVSLDLTSGAASRIGGLSGLSASGDLAINNGTLYLSAGLGVISKLATVNPNTGDATLVSGNSIGYNSTWGMDTGNDGHLYGFANSYVFEINPATGASIDGPASNYSLLNTTGVGSFDGVTTVPEPSSVIFIGLAGVAFALSRRYARNARTS